MIAQTRCESRNIANTGDRSPTVARSAGVFGDGALIGALGGGLIGLGEAEFRLPLMIGAFHFAALKAVILSRAMSLVMVVSALPFRAHSPL